MNISWDHQLARPDPTAAPVAEFYQAAQFHDEQTALWHLRAALQRRGMPMRCEIANVWYVAGRSLQIIYRLRMQDAADEIVTVRFVPRGQSEACYRSALAQAANPQAVLHLPGWDGVAWIFPEDSGLPGLHAMVDTEGISRRLSRATGGEFEPQGMDWSLLSYLPGERCTLRHRYAATERAFVGKLQKGAAASHRAMGELWASPRRRFAMARPIACDEVLGARWETFVAGRRIEELLAQVGLEEILRHIVGALVGLHRTPLQGLPPHGPTQVLQRLERKVLPRIRAALPRLGPRSEAFCRDLARFAATLPERPLGTIHGDLHTANILFDDAGPVFIDLDSLADGDPACDLALLGTRLLLLGLNGGLRSEEAGQAVAALPEFYAAAGGAAIPERVFTWYLATMLVGRQIKTCIRHLAPDLERLATVLLDQARKTLARGRLGVSGAV